MLHAFAPTISTLMIPGFVGLIETAARPFLPVRTTVEIPGPVSLTFAEEKPFECHPSA